MPLIIILYSWFCLKNVFAYLLAYTSDTTKGVYMGEKSHIQPHMQDVTMESTLTTTFNLFPRQYGIQGNSTA